jgi:hypothetical protein
MSNEGSEHGDVFLDTKSPKVGFGSAFPKTFEIGALFNSPFLRSEHSHTMGNMFPSARCFGGLLSCGLTGKAHWRALSCPQTRSKDKNGRLPIFFVIFKREGGGKRLIQHSNRSRHMQCMVKLGTLPDQIYRHVWRVEVILPCHFHS